MMKGRPILGLVSGFMFGLFGGITLFMYGAIPLHSSLLWILPLVGVVLGLVMAAWAPFGKDPEPVATPIPETVPEMDTPIHDDTLVDEVPPIEDTPAE